MTSIGVAKKIDTCQKHQLDLSPLSEGCLHALRYSRYSGDLLKIDRCFVSQKKWDMIRVIMLLASSLGLQVIAEGVETPEELAHLQQAGCKQMQGYFFSNISQSTQSRQER